MTWGGGWGNTAKKTIKKTAEQTQGRAQPLADRATTPVSYDSSGTPFNADGNPILPNGEVWTPPPANAAPTSIGGGIDTNIAAAPLAPPKPPHPFRPVDPGRASAALGPSRGLAALNPKQSDPNDLLQSRATQKMLGRFDPVLTPETLTQETFDANQGLAQQTNLLDFTNQQAAAGAPGNSQQAYTDARGELNADMRGYYDRAFENASQQLNRQMSMRGLANSGAANMGLRNLGADIYADYAKEQAGYGINRANTLGTLANNADTRQTDWSSKIGNLYGDADNLGVSQFDALLGGASDVSTAANDRAETAFGAASAADNATLNAVGSVTDTAIELGDRTSGVTIQAIQEANGWDDATFDQELSIKLGKSEDEVRRARESAEKTGKMVTWLAKAVATYYTGGAAAAV